MGQLKENLQAIKVEKEKIKAEDLPSDVTLFGIKGTIEKHDAYVPSPQVACDSNVRVVYAQLYRDGNIPNKKVIFETKGFTNVGMTLNYDQLSSALGITPEMIIQGNTILDIVGTARAYVDPTTTQDYQDCLTLTNEILGVTE